MFCVQRYNTSLKNIVYKFETKFRNECTYKYFNFVLVRWFYLNMSFSSFLSCFDSFKFPVDLVPVQLFFPFHLPFLAPPLLAPGKQTAKSIMNIKRFVLIHVNSCHFLEFKQRIQRILNGHLSIRDFLSEGSY